MFRGVLFAPAACDVPHRCFARVSRRFFVVSQIRVLFNRQDLDCGNRLRNECATIGNVNAVIFHGRFRVWSYMPLRPGHTTRTLLERCWSGEKK